MKNPVGWFDIYVADMARAQKFYESVLDVKLEDLADTMDPNVIMKLFPSDMEKYGASGALVYMEGAPVGQNSVVVYFSCDDCSVEESRIESAGGKVDKSKFAIGEHGFISIAIDTEGNVLGLHSMK